MKLLARSCAVATVLLAVTGGSGRAVGPSFDCNAVRTPLAQFICGSPDLSRTDLEFVQAYYTLRQQVGPGGWQALRQEDVDFQSRVEAQCGIAPSGDLPPDTTALAACLRQGYMAQRSLWLSRLSAAALEEARRPVEQHVGLQRDLQALGFLPPTATIDGVYGAATRAAILAWQRSRGAQETAFMGDQDAQALAGQAGKGTPGRSPSAADISGFSCKDIIGGSQKALIPVVAGEIQYMQRRYPDLTTSWGSFTQGATPEAIQQAKDIGAFVKAKCDQPGEQDAPLTSVLDAAAGFIQAGQLEAWLDQHQASPAAPAQTQQVAAAKSTDAGSRHTAAERVELDTRATVLAQEAEAGNTDAANELETQAETGDAGAMYGLSLYQMHELALAKSVILYIGLLRDRAFHDEAEAGIDVGAIPLPPDTDQDVQMRHITERLAVAAKAGDPAAQSMLGQEYWSEAIRYTDFVAVMDSSFMSQDRTQAYATPSAVATLHTLTWSCAKAKHLLTQAAQQNWPDAYMQLSFMYASTAPIPLTADSGCIVSEPARSHQLIEKGAVLGSAEARWVLREKYINEGNGAEAEKWDAKLRELADEGDYEARGLIPLHSR